MALDDDDARRDLLLNKIFEVLDGQSRGYISRVELAHILDAMQADASVKFTIPKSLVPREGMKDSRVSMADLKTLLSSLKLSDLKDVKWFAESVVKVEKELREVWWVALQEWRRRVAILYKRNLHRYLLTTQSERVSRWLLLRTSIDEPDIEGPMGLLGLGISQPEVEVLFIDETSEDVRHCSDKMEPFLNALELRLQLSKAAVEGDLKTAAPEELDSRILDLLQRLIDLARQSRELACLLVHEDTLTFVTAMVRTAAFSHQVVCAASTLIMVLIDYRIHENARDYEKLVRQKLGHYLEITCDIERLDLEAERVALHEAAPAALCGRLPLGADQARNETIAEWVGPLITLPQDSLRGEMVESLIHYDEARLSKHKPEEGVAVSLFSFGRCVLHILNRLDVSSHYTFHEPRTPLRSHLWKFLLNILSSAGERGRRLFRAGHGMHVLCSILRGNSWGVAREEVRQQEEEDRDEEVELHTTRHLTWNIAEPQRTWPHVDYFSNTGRRLYEFYPRDYVDDRFYGAKDRMLAATFLEFMASDSSFWGEAGVVEEMMQYPNTLQVLCRVKPPGFFLIRLLLQSDGFPAYMRGVARQIAEAHVELTTELSHEASVSSFSLFPVCYYKTREDRANVLQAFSSELNAVKSLNVELRILAFAYHNLQSLVKDEIRRRERQLARSEDPNMGGPASPTGTVKSPSPLPMGSEAEDNDLARLQGEVESCCELLGSRVPLTTTEIGDMAVALHVHVEELKREALVISSSLFEDSKLRSDHQCYQPAEARVNFLQGVAEFFYRPGRRPLGDPSLFPYELLVALRILQLTMLHTAAVPLFVKDLEETIEKMTGQLPPVPIEMREEAQLAGAAYPWRTGLTALRTFNVCRIPLRRSVLRHFPRNSPLEVASCLERVLEEFGRLNIGDEDPLQHWRQTRPSRRDTLLSLVFNHLCYFHPGSVTLECSQQGLALRLGLSLEFLRDLQAVLSATNPLEASHSFEGSKVGAAASFHVTCGDQQVCFVYMLGQWQLWANSTRDASKVLTDCPEVHDYFSWSSSSQPVRRRR